jgi:hypothetical protein
VIDKMDELHGDFSLQIINPEKHLALKVTLLLCAGAMLYVYSSFPHKVLFNIQEFRFMSLSVPVV